MKNWITEKDGKEFCKNCGNVMIEVKLFGKSNKFTAQGFVCKKCVSVFMYQYVLWEVELYDEYEYKNKRVKLEDAI